MEMAAIHPDPPDAQNATFAAEIETAIAKVCVKHQFFGHILITILCCFTPAAMWALHGKEIDHASWHTPLWAGLSPHMSQPSSSASPVSRQ